ncbi:hypothetical protein [Cytobacillus sp. FSL K6-0265]|uniref:hypothetical protein n=1 Tax=Cytobacillus sp. FSL K6-0265 TaxID=2921448 RepID=UPI0030FA1DA3
MDIKIMKIQKEIQHHYLKEFEDMESPHMKQLYETMVKLNAEMTAIALQKYHEEFNVNS